MLSLKDLTMPSSFIPDKLDHEDEIAGVDDAHNLARTGAILAEELYHKMAITAEDYRMRADRAVNKFRTIKQHAQTCLDHAFFSSRPRFIHQTGNLPYPHYQSQHLLI